jgi:uncharacterized tellurite resistance protein B-like protein
MFQHSDNHYALEKNAAAASALAFNASSKLASNQSNDVQKAVLNLFTAIVVADKKVLQVEIDTYANIIKDCFGEDIIAKLNYDFLAEAKHIRKILSGPSRHYWLGIQHMTLRNISDHDYLLDKLWKISISDNCLDSREADIIDFFAYLWRKN